MLKRILVYLCTCAIVLNAYSQSGPPHSGLKQGDSMQDYTFKNLINYPAKSARLTDFKGKLLLLEFWSTACASCIASWPHLMKLQEEFDDKIQIILVNTHQDEGRIRKSMEARKRVTGFDMTLPIVCGDTTLGVHLFPHSGVPFVVWIGADRRVLSISTQSSLTTENIRRILAGDNPPLKKYVDNNQYYRPDFLKPLFVNGNGGEAGEVLSQSILAKSSGNLWPAIAINSNPEKSSGFAYASDSYPTDLFRLAYSDEKNPSNGQIEMLPLSRVITNLNDSVSYDYHLLCPISDDAKVQELMREDLKRYFPVQAKFTTKRMNCLVLAASDKDLIAYKGQAGGKRVNASRLTLNNVTTSWFIHRLKYGTDYYKSSFPIIDETDFAGMLGGIDIEVNLNDPAELNKALQKYKMSLTVQEREVKVLVLDPLHSYHQR